MMLKPQLYETKKKGKFIELRLYVAGRRVKSLSDRIPSCFGFGNRINCRCRCSIKRFCRKVSIQFGDD